MVGGEHGAEKVGRKVDEQDGMHAVLGKLIRHIPLKIGERCLSGWDKVGIKRRLSEQLMKVRW